MPVNNIASWPYNPFPLLFYDYTVLKFSSAYIWGCPLPLLQSLYDEHIREKHLEIGVGTGYFLDHCQRIQSDYEITLLDINPTPLQQTKNRLRRYKTEICLADVMKPLPLKEGLFLSVGMNFVLHCLPGSKEKMRSFYNIRSVMAPNATFFGSTVLATASQNGLATRSIMNFYNTTYAFHNKNDYADGFIKSLEGLFNDVEAEIIGGVLRFVART